MSAEIIVWDLVKDLTPRVYLNNAPQNPQRPFLLVTLVGGSHDHVLGGAAGVFNAEFQFDAVSDEQADCISIIESIRQKLDGYSDSNVMYSVVLLDDWADMMPDDNSDQYIYRKAARYSIRIRESIP